MGSIHPGLPDETLLTMPVEQQQSALANVAAWYASEPRLADGTPVSAVRAGVINTPAAVSFNALESQVKAANDRAAALEEKLSGLNSTNEALALSLRTQTEAANRAADAANRTLAEKTLQMKQEAETLSRTFMEDANARITAANEAAAKQAAELSALVKKSMDSAEVARRAAEKAENDRLNRMGELPRQYVPDLTAERNTAQGSDSKTALLISAAGLLLSLL